MIKILDNSKSLDLLINDTTNGLGQFEATSCLITEELNGIYECEIEMLATDEHFNDIQVGGLLEIPVSEIKKQIFRIYFISKPINQVVQIKAQHITYDLNKVPVKPFSATGAVNAKNGMLNNTMGTYPFTMTTNITNTTSKFILDIPRSFRECLGGYEGSLLDTFRCEYEWDNLEVKMLSKRGNDNGVRIAYGKNLTDFNQEENIENVYTSVLGYAVVNDITYTGEIYHKVQATYPKVLIVDFSDQYEQDTTPTTADLTTKAQEYATNNDIEVPNVNLSISFVPLWQTEEYKNVAPLERVSLGDTVHVFFDKLGVEASARVVKTVFNANLNRFDSVELGNAKANLNTVINEVVSESKKEVANSENFLAAQLNDMATLIINGLGLHRTYVEDGEGGYRIYLHNKSTLTESDTQYIFTSEGFLVSTDYGQTWNAGFDSEGNAVLNSLATITLRALEISGGTITGNKITGGTINGTTINASTINASHLRFGNATYPINIAPYSTSSATGEYTSGGAIFSGNGGIKAQVGDAIELVVCKNASGATADYYCTLTLDTDPNDEGYIWLSVYDGNGNYVSRLSMSNSSMFINNYGKPIYINGFDSSERGDVYINGHKLTFSNGNVGYE